MVKKDNGMPKALRFKGYSRVKGTDGVASIAPGHDVVKRADWGRFTGDFIVFICSCGARTGAINAQPIQEHAHAIDPTRWGTWWSLQTPAWAKNLSDAKRQFKVANASYLWVRQGPDFIYSMSGRSAYAETERALDKCSVYFVAMAREAYRAVHAQ
tara:strand:- start:62 stop:529 length:468 start_codon:yes stop_codon:yes gene_type:complete